MLKLLQTLCCLDGVSGGEDAVRDFIRTQEVVYGVVNIKERLNVREKPDSNSKLAFM